MAFSSLVRQVQCRTCIHFIKMAKLSLTPQRISQRHISFITARHISRTSYLLVDKDNSFEVEENGSDSSAKAQDRSDSVLTVREGSGSLHEQGRAQTQLSGHTTPPEQGAVDYSYFQNIISSTKKVRESHFETRVEIDHLANEELYEPSHEGSELAETSKPISKEEKGIQTQPGVDITKPVKVPGLKRLKPHLAVQSATLTPFVNDSVVLQNLLSLGVDLSRVEMDRNASAFFMKCDWEKHIQPYMVWLHQMGVPDSELGTLISKNPSFFLQNMEDLNVRVAYFKSKAFPQESIARILYKAPRILSQTVKQTDTQLGYIQKEFKLSGPEMRTTITRFPKLATWDKRKIYISTRHIREILGFSQPQIKPMILAYPKIFTMDKNALENRFNYLYEKIGISHESIVQWPSIFRTRRHIIKQRHLFLKHLGRDQFDPTKENFVTLKSLATGNDPDFCDNVAKVKVRVYRDFLKTL